MIPRGRTSYPGLPAGRIPYEIEAYFLKHSKIMNIFEKTEFPSSFLADPSIASAG